MSGSKNEREIPFFKGRRRFFRFRRHHHLNPITIQSRSPLSLLTPHSTLTSGGPAVFSPGRKLLLAIWIQSNRIESGWKDHSLSLSMGFGCRKRSFLSFILVFPSFFSFFPPADFHSFHFSSFAIFHFATNVGRSVPISSLSLSTADCFCPEEAAATSTWSNCEHE